jgi:hypothetical protein
MTTTTDTTIPVVSTLTTVTEDVVATATPVMPVPRVRGAVAASAAKVEAPKVFKLGVHAVLTANITKLGEDSTVEFELIAGHKVFISSVSPLQVSDKEGRTVTVAPEQIKTMKGRPCKVPVASSVAPVVAVVSAPPVVESSPPVVASLEAVVEVATVVTEEVSAAVDEAFAEALMESEQTVPVLD